MKENQYIVLKKKVDFATKNLKNCCKTGCSFCCYQLIEVFDFEEQTIKDAINKLDDNNKAIIKKNLESWFTFFNENTPNEKVLDEHDTISNMINLGLSKKHPCPLLINNLCSIYNNRPLACRVHVVESNPELCEKDPYRASSKESHSIRNKIFSEIKQKKGKYYMTFLPYIATEIIKIESQIKPIKKLYIK
ncbi:YkgJ family cysteine cluster protein [Chryseobacterium sp. WX]|uniref:YkgJ family cysteine cluster protein n=1 Tax=Chryseobacterium sp. WX TaxID=3031803 RepID=UPI00240A78DD|nr:YkgJ family cysteine cluster protein [Chryseobacterium sp. WX]WFB65505.1 YkgJ family cysteine cluster protein [Chryseobacterium sp. WX]